MSDLSTHPILLCYDGSPGAQRAIHVAGALFPGREAVVLHIWRPLAGVVAAYAIVPIATYDETELRRAAMQLATDGAALAASAGLDARPEIAEATFDSDWRAIVNAADSVGAGLVVLGARGLSAFKSVVLGSVSHGVSQHSHVPVLIVPPPTADSELEAAEASTATVTA